MIYGKIIKIEHNKTNILFDLLNYIKKFSKRIQNK